MASKSLWLGAGVVAVLVVASSIGLYQYAFAPNNDGPVGGPVEMPSTRGDFSLTQLMTIKSQCFRLVIHIAQTYAR